LRREFGADPADPVLLKLGYRGGGDGLEREPEILTRVEVVVSVRLVGLRPKRLAVESGTAGPHPSSE
jgi:hypothetical protein